MLSFIHSDTNEERILEKSSLNLIPGTRQITPPDQPRVVELRASMAYGPSQVV